MVERYYVIEKMPHWDKFNICQMAKYDGKPYEDAIFKDRQLAEEFKAMVESARKDSIFKIEEIKIE